MNINSNIIPTEKKFNDLEEGECFIDEYDSSIIFMKIIGFKVESNRCSEDYNSIDLNSGGRHYFDSVSNVYPVNVELNVLSYKE